PLRYAALNLPFHQTRVDRAADIVSGDDAPHPGGSELDIDFDLGDLCRESVGRIGDTLAVRIELRSRRIEVPRTEQHVAMFRDWQSREIDHARSNHARSSVVAQREHAIAQLDRRALAHVAELEDLTAQILAGTLGRVARHIGLTRGRGLTG